MQNSSQNLYKKILGEVGEKKALKYLKKKGYKIKEKGYVTPLGEADIVAFDKETLVFIEVKTRTSDNFGKGREAVNYYKQQRYVKIAKYYTVCNKIKDVNIRFDVIEIQNEQINHIISAFEA